MPIWNNLHFMKYTIIYWIICYYLKCFRLKNVVWKLFDADRICLGHVEAGGVVQVFGDPFQQLVVDVIEPAAWLRALVVDQVELRRSAVAVFGCGTSKLQRCEDWICCNWANVFLHISYLWLCSLFEPLDVVVADDVVIHVNDWVLEKNFDLQRPKQQIGIVSIPEFAVITDFKVTSPLKSTRRYYHNPRAYLKYLTSFRPLHKW